MAVYIVTGKLGSGKTLVAVGMIRDALRQGRRVATNVDLWLENLISWKNKSCVVYRLPDKLSAASFEAIGPGNEHFKEVRDRKLYDEEKNGLIVLDEGGLSMNSRDYREEGRKEFIQWCIHSRKRGWDVAIIVQHFDTLDKQIRDMFGEHIVYCMRFDRMAIPFIGWVLRLVGFKGTGAKVHMATCRYGQFNDSPVAWRKAFKGADLWMAYDTRQQYFPSEDEAVYQLLPPWYVKGRIEKPENEWKAIWEDFYNGYLGIKVSRVFVFFCAMTFGAYAHAKYFVEDNQPVKSSLSGSRAADTHVVDLSKGADPGGELVLVEDPWESAHLSTHVQLEGGRWIVKVKSSEGEALELPKGGMFFNASPCQASALIEGRVYPLTCRKPF